MTAGGNPYDTSGTTPLDSKAVRIRYAPRPPDPYGEPPTVSMTYHVQGDPPMTTPDPARTAARNDFITTTAARHFPDAIRLCAEGHARGEHAMPPRDEIAVDCIHGAIALANKLEEMNAAPWCLPEPQASTTSEPYTPPPGTPDIRCAMCGSGMMTRLELGRLRRRVAELEAAIPSPASEASQCAFSPGVCNDPKCPDCGPLVASAPPPASEAGRPKCPHCGNNVLVVPRGPHLSDEDGDDTRWFGKQWFCNGCCSWFSAPPPSTGDILDRAVAWVEEKYPTRGHTTGELLRECVAEISTLRHAARVTPPQQQEDDRSWEKGCEVRANGIVSCPSGTSITGSVYLVPDGRWLTYDQWLLLTPPSDRFPTESAARAALAKAPRPPA